MSNHTDVSKVRKLGRGLSALLQTPVAIELTPRPTHRIGDVEASVGVNPQQAATLEAPQKIANSSEKTSGEGESLGRGGVAGGGGVENIAVASIRPSRFKARRVFDEAPLKTLAESIRSAGVMQPVIVRSTPAGDGARYELIAGERRWRAAQLAGLQRVPAIIRELGDEEAAEWGLIENVQREDLNAMDRAHALRMMSERFGLSHARIAEKVGLERATVANLVRLTELEPEVAELISASALASAHGKALLALPPGAERIRIAREAARGEWSVRKIEAEVKRSIAVAPGTVPHVPAHDVPADAKRAVVLDLERRMSQQLGTKVHIQSSGGGKGKITIEFYGLDHFDGLMTRMGVK